MQENSTTSKISWLWIPCDPSLPQEKNIFWNHSLSSENYQTLVQQINKNLLLPLFCDQQPGHSFNQLFFPFSQSPNLAEAPSPNWVLSVHQVYTCNICPTPTGTISGSKHPTVQYHIVHLSSFHLISMVATSRKGSAEERKMREELKIILKTVWHGFNIYIPTSNSYFVIFTPKVRLLRVWGFRKWLDYESGALINGNSTLIERTS